jgi:ankyrin repeat protein
MSDQATDPLVGSRIGNHLISRRIGKGGMGMVYQARHIALEREVAIKFLPANVADNVDFVERFFREARAAAHLNHPNITTVHDAGVEDGVYYFVMEYVEGQDLAHLLREKGKIPEKDAIRYGISIATALAYAHKHQIIHRDIKPENIFLNLEGEIKVGDLGLAKQIGESDSSITISGMVVGTPYYISPEQIRGLKDVDARTDIYSLGAALYHLVTGQVPYSGSSATEIMSNHLTEAFHWPQTVNPDLSDGFCHILQKMMAKNRDERYQSMNEVIQALIDCQEGKMIVAPTVAPLESGIAPKPKSSRKPAVWIVAASLFILAGFGAAYYLKLIPRMAPVVPVETQTPVAAPESAKMDSKESAPVTSKSSQKEVSKAPVKSSTPEPADKTAPIIPSREFSPQADVPPALTAEQLQAKLVEAVKNGDAAGVREMFQLGADPDSRDEEKRPLLLNAISKNQTEITKLFLDKGANVNVRSADGWTYLMKASNAGHPDIVKLLLQNGANVNAKTDEGWTALMLAAGNGHSEVVEQLLARNANLNSKNQHGNTALLHALGNKRMKAAEVLVRGGAQVNVKNQMGHTALMLAKESGDQQMVQLLLSAGATSGEVASNPLKPASAELPTAPSAPVISTPKQPSRAELLGAASSGNTELVRSLISQGASAEALSDALRSAVNAGKADVVRILLASGANPNIRTHNNWTPFLYAVNTGETEIIRMMLEQKADVNARTLDGWSALSLASVNGQLPNVKVLVQHGAEINYKGVDGNTALLQAVKRNHLSVVEFLLNVGADPNIANNQGETARSIALQRGNAKLAELLKTTSRR